MGNEATFSNSKIDRAGKLLATEGELDLERESAQHLVNEWRASFTLPLSTAFERLREMAISISSRAICSRRLKRMESIVSKLSRHEMRGMKLSRMQDVGGCRAVLPNFRNAENLRYEFESQTKTDGTFVDFTDYISSPKAGGYRSYHFVLRPFLVNQSAELDRAHRIEIQMRTALQHAWATTVETVDMFRGQKIKIGAGLSDWNRFFLLASTVLASEELLPVPTGTPEKGKELAQELDHLTRRLNPFQSMEGWKAAIQEMDRVVHETNHKIALVTVDFRYKSVVVEPYSTRELDRANERYALVEEEIRRGRKAHSVLVAVDKLRDLREAYPNLYQDTEVFNHRVSGFIRNWL